MLNKLPASFIVIIVFLLSCNDASDTELLWKYENPQINKYFKTKLTSKNIKYRVDDENNIWFKSSNYSQVEGIKKEIYSRYLKNSISFTNESQVDELCSNIKKDGHDCVTWYSAKGYKWASWLDEGQASAEKFLQSNK